MSALDDYLDGLDAATRAALEHVRDVVMDAVPDAEQGMTHGMAALKHRRRPLVGFLAAKEHLSIFPFSSDDVVRDIVRRRVHEIDHPLG